MRNVMTILCACACLCYANMSYAQSNVSSDGLIFYQPDDMKEGGLMAAYPLYEEKKDTEHFAGTKDLETILKKGISVFPEDMRSSKIINLVFLGKDAISASSYSNQSNVISVSAETLYYRPSLGFSRGKTIIVQIMTNDMSLVDKINKSKSFTPEMAKSLKLKINGWNFYKEDFIVLVSK